MKLGVLTGRAAAEDGWHVRDIVRAAQECGATIAVLDFRQLEATIRPVAPATLLCGGVSLQALDAVVVRSMPRGSLEEVIFRMDVLQRLAASGVRVINNPRALEASIDKYLSLARLAGEGLPVPETVACEDGADPCRLFDSLGGDVISKPLFGSEGRGMRRFRRAEDLLAHVEEKRRDGGIVYLQRFVPHGGFDYRVLVHSGEPLAAVRRVNERDWRSNVAQGGRVERADVPAAIQELAVRAAAALNCEFAGVDVLAASDGALWVLEVNAVPGWRAAAAALERDIAADFVARLQTALVRR